MANKIKCSKCVPSEGHVPPLDGTGNELGMVEVITEHADAPQHVLFQAHPAPGTRASPPSPSLALAPRRRRRLAPGAAWILETTSSVRWKPGI